MSSILPSGSTSNISSDPNAISGGGLQAVSTDDFLALMIAELQSQDPLDPVDNAEMIQQVAMLREISSTDNLAASLTGLSDSQQLVTASSLIGKEVSGVDTEGSSVQGIVDRVVVETGESATDPRNVKVQVGTQTIDIRNIREIQPQ